MFSFTREAFINFIRLLFFIYLVLSDLWGTVRCYIRWLLKLLRLGLLIFSMCCEGFFVVFKRGFLLKKALKENIYILLPLTINSVAYNVVRRWKGYKKLLKHLYLVKRVLHGRVDGLNHSRQALDVNLSILNTNIVGYLVGHEFVEVLSANRESFIIVLLFKYVSHFFCILARFHALFVHVININVNNILYLRVGLLKTSYVGHRCSDNCYLYSLFFKVFF
jgi:hypothetical protein